MSTTHRPLTVHKTRELRLRVEDQRLLLAHLSEAFPLHTGFVSRVVAELRDSLAEADAVLPRRLTEFDDEPPEGSVIMAHGLGGSSWQRSYADGLWRSAYTDRPRAWSAFDREFSGAGVWLILLGEPR